jgi:hypothetical protein
MNRKDLEGTVVPNTGIPLDSAEGLEKLVTTAGNPAEIRSVPPKYKTRELPLQKRAR